MIIKTLIKIILQENSYKKITGDVLTLGPQTLPLSIKELDMIIQNYNVKLKTGTSKRYPVPSMDKQASAEYFFKQLGANKVDAIDVTLEAGANIQHNLNNQIDENKYQKYDFIFDGGTFDHLINLENAFDSISKLLKPGGRIIMWNATSNYIGAAYIMFGPDLFYDYFVTNKYKDCKVYIFREKNNYPNALRECFYLINGVSKKLNNKAKQSVVVIAEKGNEIENNTLPVERSYRPDFMNLSFIENEKKIKSSVRPILKGKITFYRNFINKINILYYLYFEFFKILKKTKNPINFKKKFKRKLKKIIDYKYLGMI